MGGHWAYVAASYAVVAIGLAGLWLASLRGLRARQAELERLESPRPGGPRR